MHPRTDLGGLVSAHTARNQGCAWHLSVPGSVELHPLHGDYGMRPAESMSRSGPNRAVSNGSSAHFGRPQQWEKLERAASARLAAKSGPLNLALDRHRASAGRQNLTGRRSWHKEGKDGGVFSEPSVSHSQVSFGPKKGNTPSASPTEQPGTKPARVKKLKQGLKK